MFIEQPFIEPYPSEYPLIHHAYAELDRRFSNTKMTDSSIEQFNQAALTLFGEAGFEIDVAWDEVRQDGQPTGMYLPQITLIGRTIKKETEVDHDRMKHEVRAGMADGKPGVVDVNTGEWKEESKKKIL